MTPTTGIGPSDHGPASAVQDLSPLGRRSRDHLLRRDPGCDEGPHRSPGSAGGEPTSQVRYDALLGEWVGIAGHRQTRTYHPPANQCPLCPSTPGNASEIPSAELRRGGFREPVPVLRRHRGTAGGGRHRRPLPGNGRCEVVCFTADHTATFSSLPPPGSGRSSRPGSTGPPRCRRMPGVEQVFCFENRGVEIGVTLAHPHGQIYGYPFVTPQAPRRCCGRSQAHREATGRNLFADILAARSPTGRGSSRRTNTGWRSCRSPPVGRWRCTCTPAAGSATCPASATRNGTTWSDLPGSAAPDGGRVRRHPPGDHGLAPGPGARGPGRLLAAPARCSPSAARSGRLKYLAGSESGDGRLRQRHHPRDAAQRLRDCVSGGGDTPMKCLVAGGAGYIGSVVTRLLLAEGHRWWCWTTAPPATPSASRPASNWSGPT